MDALRNLIHAIAAEHVEAASVSVALPRKAGVHPVFDWVSGYLIENPQSVLQLYLYHARPGVPRVSVFVTSESIAKALDSAEFSETFRVTTADFGSAGQGSLPGQSSYRPRKFKCPVCGREVNAIPIDGLPPPNCMNRHPPRHMEAE